MFRVLSRLFRDAARARVGPLSVDKKRARGGICHIISLHGMCHLFESSIPAR